MSRRHQLTQQSDDTHVTDAVLAGSRMCATTSSATCARQNWWQSITQLLSHFNQTCVTNAAFAEICCRAPGFFAMRVT